MKSSGGVQVGCTSKNLLTLLCILVFRILVIVVSLRFRPHFADRSHFVHAKVLNNALPLEGASAANHLNVLHSTNLFVTNLAGNCAINLVLHQVQMKYKDNSSSKIL